LSGRVDSGERSRAAIDAPRAAPGKRGL
jgi:hypothetical protein